MIQTPWIKVRDRVSLVVKLNQSIDNAVYIGTVIAINGDDHVIDWGRTYTPRYSVFSTEELQERRCVVIPRKLSILSKIFSGYRNPR